MILMFEIWAGLCIDRGLRLSPCEGWLHYSPGNTGRFFYVVRETAVTICGVTRRAILKYGIAFDLTAGLFPTSEGPTQPGGFAVSY